MSQTHVEVQHDVLLFDLDGVVYVGPHAVPGAVAAIAAASARGGRCCFVTNKASRTPEEVAQHLQDLGVDATAHDVVTSSQAGAGLVAERVDSGEVLAVGGRGVTEALRERGFDPVSAFDSGTVAVMQGYGADVGWRDLAEATYAIRAGLPWIATNLDMTFPTPRGLAPGNGAMVGAVAAAVGRGPDAVAGKPEPALLLEAIRRTSALRPLMIGDRLDTDIAAGGRLGIETLLVMTGVCNDQQLLAAQGDEIPTFACIDLSCIESGTPLPAYEPGTWHSTREGR
jgi:HAD superfamily hydrolase (TIGR01450 family)